MHLCQCISFLFLLVIYILLMTNKKKRHTLKESDKSCLLAALYPVCTVV